MMLNLRPPLLITRNGRRLFGTSGMRKLVVARGERQRELRELKVRRIKEIPEPSNSEASVFRSHLYKSEEALPPIVILEAARKSGVINISPEKALDLLRRYQELEKQRDKVWEEQLCMEFDIKPPTLVLLSMVLNRCPHVAQRHLARRVMLSASKLGNQEATFRLIVSGIRSGSFKDYEQPLKRLQIMAKENNPTAMTLLGRILANQGRDGEALELFRKATRGPAGLGFEGAGEALVCEGQLLMEQNAKEAETIFRKAAFELDDPSAYYYLSELQEESSLNQAVYLMKAASSGIVEAAHKLGSVELLKAKESSASNSSPNHGMAREWFHLAAAGEYGPSMLSMAQICRECGELDEGLQWLNKAKKLEDVRQQALEMEDKWERLGA